MKKRCNQNILQEQFLPTIQENFFQHDEALVYKNFEHLVGKLPRRVLAPQIQIHHNMEDCRNYEEEGSML